MKRLKRVRKGLETVFVRLAFRWVPAWSRRSVVRVARCAGTLAALLPLPQRRIAYANMDIVFGEKKSPAEKKTLLREACCTFALVLLDVFWFSRDTRQRATEWVTFPPLLDELFEEKRQMCVTAHLGNWELLGHAVSARGYPLHSVAAPLVNPAVDALFLRARTASGQVIIPREGALRVMLRTLKGEGKVGLLLDQNTRPSQGGVFVDVMGLPAPVSDAAAALAIKTQSDILFGFCIPDREGHYHVHSVPKIAATEYLRFAQPREAVLEITRQIAQRTETAIREHPHAWLWMYKRWKHVPPDGVRADYPFYAKSSPAVPVEREAATRKAARSRAVS